MGGCYSRQTKVDKNVYTEIGTECCRQRDKLVVEESVIITKNDSSRISDLSPWCGHAGPRRLTRHISQSTCLGFIEVPVFVKYTRYT